MTLRFVPLRRIAGLSVAITLITAPIASAQVPAPASNTEAEAPANTVLLSRAAFSRLVQAPQPDVAPATAAMAREARATAAKAPQQASWASRHKVISGVIILVVAVFGVVALCASILGCWEE